MQIDALPSILSNIISALAGVFLGLGTMWFSKVNKKEFNDFSKGINKKIDKLEADTVEIKDKIYQKLIELSSDVAVIKDREGK